jgi:hypothetical protein
MKLLNSVLMRACALRAEGATAQDDSEARNRPGAQS